MVAMVSGKAVERQTGASMMEQLVPEITTHALSYLDYLSLCRLSMTNSLMRKAANDDNAWKALYHKVYQYVCLICVYMVGLRVICWLLLNFGVNCDRGKKVCICN